MLSPDGRYLFLTSGGAGSDDIYWIDASIIRTAVRYPTYATVNARVERRFAIGQTTLAVYADIWNLLGRENIGWIEGWSAETGDIFKLQMPRTPFVGMGVIF
jgi:hypothetical protein